MSVAAAVVDGSHLALAAAPRSTATLGAPRRGHRASTDRPPPPARGRRPDLPVPDRAARPRRARRERPPHVARCTVGLADGASCTDVPRGGARRPVLKDGGDACRRGTCPSVRRSRGGAHVGPAISLTLGCCLRCATATRPGAGAIRRVRSWARRSAAGESRSRSTTSRASSRRSPRPRRLCTRCVTGGERSCRRLRRGWLRERAVRGSLRAGLLETQAHSRPSISCSPDRDRELDLKFPSIRERPRWASTKLPPSRRRAPSV